MIAGIVILTIGTLLMEEERKDPAEEALQKYAAYMKQLLDSAGYSK